VIDSHKAMGRLFSIRGWAKWPVLLGGILTLVDIVCVAAGVNQTAWGETMCEFLLLAVGLLSVCFAARLSLSHRARGRVSVAWALFAASLLAFWAGEVIWVVQDSLFGGAQSPSFADAGYLAYYPLLVAASFLLARWAGDSRGDRLRMGLDMFTILLGGGLLVWFFVLQPALEGAGATMADAISVAYPLCDLLLILGIAALAVRPNRLRSRWALYVLLTAVLAGFIADLAYGRSETMGIYQNGGAIDAVYMVSWFLFGLAAALEYSANKPERTATPESVALSTLPRPFLLPSLALAFVVGVLVWSLVSIFDAREGVVAVVVVFFALTSMGRQILVMREASRFHEQQAVAASEEYFQRILRRTQFSVDHATETIMWLKEDGRIAEANEAACEQTGYSRDELMRMTVFDVDARLSEHPEVWSEGWVMTRRQGSSLLESVMRTKSGREYPVEVRADYMEFDGEAFNCAFVRDIGDRKEAEATLRKTEQQLRQAQKMEAIGQLAGGIAHDFNNLLAVIRGYSELALMTGPVADEHMQEALEAIKSAADRGASLTGQILLFSRRAPLRPEVVETNHVVKDAEALLRRTLGEDIQLVTTLDPDAGWVRLDVHDFQQAITNLAVNARDAMPKGGRLSITSGSVELDQAFCGQYQDVVPGPYVVLTVSDTGVGMSADTKNRAFEPFFTTKDIGKGTGLGLSAVYGTVRQNRGLVLLESELGAGTTFTIYLPRVEPAAK
jgi:PAS domain S-box-containing protein